MVVRNGGIAVYFLPASTNLSCVIDMFDGLLKQHGDDLKWMSGKSKQIDSGSSCV